MLVLSSSTRYFLCGEPTDLRFGINSLAGLIRNRLGFDPVNGAVFPFLGKTAQSEKVAGRLIKIILEYQIVELRLVGAGI
jgi:transposase